MQHSTEDEKPTGTQRKAAMNWIGSLLQTIANSLSLPITAWHWQMDGTNSDTAAYKLVVIGTQNKRVIKLFTVDELDRCLSDRGLQSEIDTRLTRLVSFLAG